MDYNGGDLAMIKIVVVNEESKKKTFGERLESFKRKAADIFETVKYRVSLFWRDHWQTILKWAPAVLAAIGGIIKIVKPSAAELHEKRMAKTWYDPSTGFHWELKRDLTNHDRIEIMERRRAGEKVEDILRGMKIMK
jgi:hypothetical protein